MSWWRTILVSVICWTAALAGAKAMAQTGMPDSQFQLQDRASSPNQNRSAQVNPDTTLEIAPRSGGAPGAATTSSPATTRGVARLPTAIDQGHANLPATC